MQLQGHFHSFWAWETLLEFPAYERLLTAIRELLKEMWVVPVYGGEASLQVREKEHPDNGMAKV
jgi:hypothetical protein